MTSRLLVGQMKEEWQEEIKERAVNRNWFLRSRVGVGFCST